MEEVFSGDYAPVSVSLLSLLKAAALSTGAGGDPPKLLCAQPFVVAPERSDSDSKGRRRSQVDATQEKYHPGKLIVEVRTTAGFGSLAGPISGLSSGEGRVADACTAVRAQACQRVKDAAQLKAELIAAYGRPCCNAC